MARTVLQPGFRFHPTDVELVMYHLKRKVTEKSVPFEAIRELDLYKFAPWDLPDKSCLQTGDLEWYFFCARDKKYANGMRANRATDIGYWKTTGRDKPVAYESRTVGMIKSLVFHIGRAPRGDRTNWVMREYRLQDQVLADAGISQDSYVLCRVFEKSGAGPRNGAQYGAPYKEEDWEEDLSSNLVPVTVTDPGSPMVPPVDPQNIVMKNRGLIIGDSTGPSSEPIPCHDCSEKHPFVDDGDVEPSLTGLKEKELPHHVGNGNNEKPDMSTIESAVESPTAEEADDIFNDLEDLSSPAELKKADSIDDLSNLGSKYAPSLVLLEDDGSYMQLCDLDSPMDLPVIANAFEQLPYRDIGTNSKPELVKKFKSSEYMEDESNRDKTFLPMDGEYVELGDLMSSVTVPVKSNASCPTFSSNSRLETAYKFHGSISSWDNLFMDQVIENDRSYMELNDLVNPLVCPNEGDCSTGNRYDAGDLQVLPKRSIRWDAGLPYHQVDNSIGGTSVSGYDGSVQNAGTPLGSAAGEGTFLPREEEHVRGKQQRLAYSRSWSLLDSIPARPASAAEHPPINGGKGSKGSNDVFGYCGGSSSIHFKAEVIVRCKCTEEALSGKSGEEQRCSSCLYCHRARMTDLGKEAVVTWGGGFTFVFLLGMVMVLFWVCFLAVSVKISLYTLKLILS